MDVATALSVGTAVLVVVALPLVSYIVTRRDKDFDSLKADKKEAHAVLHRKADDIERRVLNLELEVAKLVPQLAEMRDDARDNKRALEMLRSELYRPRTGTSTAMTAVRPPPSPSPPRR